MIEKTVLNILKLDSVISGIVAKFEGNPAIFSDFAPEEAKKPYITFEIERDNDSVRIVQEMNILIDFWDVNKSRKNARIVSERIEYLFDFKIFNNDDRYDSIRTWFSDGGWMPESDPRVARYNHSISVRASRKKWSEQI